MDKMVMQSSFIKAKRTEFWTLSIAGVVLGAYEIVRLWLTFALDDISGGGGKVQRGQSSWEVAGGQKGLGFEGEKNSQAFHF